MKASWFSYFPSLEKDEVKSKFIAASEVFTVLSEMLNDEIESLHKQARAPANYELPAWSEKQADILGQQRAYYHVLSLLEK